MRFNLNAPRAASATSPRRRPLRRAATAGALAMLVALWLAAPAPAAATTPNNATTSQQIGLSVEGRPLEVGCLGSGDHTLLLVGGLHTGPEAHSSELLLQIAQLAWSGDFEVPPGTRLCLLPTLNPDGLASGERTNARGVDLNRNWPTPNWRADAYHPEGGPVSGGAKPISEPETAALWTYILESRPAAVLVFHCCGAVVEGNDRADAAALPAVYGSGARMTPIAQWTAYPVTGQFIDAMDRVGIPAMDVEMRSLEDTAVDEHRAGIAGVLVALGAPPPLAGHEGAQRTVAERTYVVRSGDTLAAIGARFAVTATRLATVNQLARPEFIQVGAVLIIP